MGTPFEDACLAASNAVDTVYGGAWDFQPMRADDPNARHSPDPDRAALTIVGVYIAPFARASSGPARHPGVKPERPGHASSRPILECALAQFPQPPRAKDRVTRQKTGITYQIAEIRPDGTGRAEIDLNQLS